MFTIHTFFYIFDIIHFKSRKIYNNGFKIVKKVKEVIIQERNNDGCGWGRLIQITKLKEKRKKKIKVELFEMYNNHSIAKFK